MLAHHAYYFQRWNFLRFEPKLRLKRIIFYQNKFKQTRFTKLIYFLKVFTVWFKKTKHWFIEWRIWTLNNLVSFNESWYKKGPFKNTQKRGILFNFFLWFFSGSLQPFTIAKATLTSIKSLFSNKGRLQHYF